jgi:hypothetical protein
VPGGARFEQIFSRFQMRPYEDARDDAAATVFRHSSSALADSFEAVTVVLIVRRLDREGLDVPRRCVREFFAAASSDKGAFWFRLEAYRLPLRGTLQRGGSAGKCYPKISLTFSRTC